jgi:hypothetical protein
LEAAVVIPHMQPILGAAEIVTFAIYALLSAGASYAAYAFTKPKTKKQSGVNQEPTYAARGSYCPIILGTRRVAPNVCWVGDRQFRTGDSGNVTRNEKAMHVLCVGPVYALNGVWSNGKKIWPLKGDNRVTHIETDSGTLLHCQDDSYFKIYWGFKNQPADADLIGLMGNSGASSSWPNFCYVIWKPFRLGPATTWPQIEYEVEVRLLESPLEGSPPMMDTSVPDGTQEEIENFPIEGTCRSFGIIPAGDYKVRYERGAMQYSSLPRWRVQGNHSANTGFQVQGTLPSLSVWCPGNEAAYDNQAACEADNAGVLTPTFTWAGGQLKLCLNDSGGYDNNQPGNPNPTFSIIGVTDPTFIRTIEGTHKPNETSIIKDSGPGTWAPKDSGCNPAHVLWRILTMPYPHGLAMPTDWLYSDAFETMGIIANDEHIPVNVEAAEGNEAGELVGDLMNDFGFALPQVGPKLVPVMVRPLRDGETAIVIIQDATVDPEPEVEQYQGDFTPDRIVYIVKDAILNYRDFDIPFDDDGVTRPNRRVQEKKINLNTVTDRVTGQKVGKRRLLEERGQKVVYKFDAIRDARIMFAGLVVDYPNVGNLRVVDTTISWKTTKVTVNAMFDQYSLATGDYLPPDVVGVPPDPGNGNETPGPDLYIRAFALPAKWGGSGHEIIVPRVRRGPGIIGARVLASTNDIDYIDIGAQDPPSVGGLLNIDLPDYVEGVDDEEFTYPVTFFPFNIDVSTELIDLSTNDGAFNAGEQVVVIDAEWFLLRNVIKTNGGWELVGLKRVTAAQMPWSVPGSHTRRTPIIVFRKVRLSVLTAAFIEPGASIHIKTVASDGIATYLIAASTGVTIPP